MLMDTSSLAWLKDAACGRVDLDLFFRPEEETPTEQRQREHAAKTICSECPVMLTCRDYAIEGKIAYGIWGGLTEAERGIRTRKRPERYVSRLRRAE